MASRTYAQSEHNAGFGEHSAAYPSPAESEVESALTTFRELHDPATSSIVLGEGIRTTASPHADDWSLPEQELWGSSSLFSALAGIYQRRPQLAQQTLEQTLRTTGKNSALYTKASLLSALGYYSHQPLRQEDVESGLSRLRGLENGPSVDPEIRQEIYFWRAEGERALGFNREALTHYGASLDVGGNNRLDALTRFRRAELYEYKAELAAAAIDFRAVMQAHGSPLRLQGALRLAAIERSLRAFPQMLRDLTIADSLASSLPRSTTYSARELSYLSPLIEAMMLRADNTDRVLGANASLAERSAIRSAAHDTEIAQVASPFWLSEIGLLRGSALSSLGRYDSAASVFGQAQRVLDGSARLPDDRGLARQRDFLRDALTFELAWAEFRQAQYDTAATDFLLLVDRDSTVHRLISRDANLTLREQGRYADPFYEERDSVRNATLDPSALAHSSFDTTFFIYNDFPERARFYAGVSLARAGELKKAERLFVGLTQDRSVIYSSLANYQLGLLKFEEKNYVEAASILEPLSTEESQTGGFSSLLMGEINYRKNDFERAERYFRQALSQLSDTLPLLRATAYLERGLSLIPLGSWDLAQHDLRRFLELTPGERSTRKEEALFWLGRADFRAGRLDSARVELAHFLRQYPNSDRAIDAEYHYAWTLFRLNRWDSAEAHFENVIALDSVSRYAYDVLARAGDCYYAVGDYDDATDLYNQAIDRPAFNNYRTTRALFQLGLTRLRLDSARSAIRSFEYLLRKFPKTELADEAHFNIALAAFAINVPNEAEAALQKIGGSEHNSALVPRSLLLLADERMARGQEAAAIPTYQQILDFHSGSPQALPALFHMQDAMIDLKRNGQAIAAADTFVARMPMSPSVPDVLLRKGQLLFGMGQWKAASETMQHLILAYPANPIVPDARLILGRSATIAGDTAAALEQYRIVLLDSGENSAPAEAHYELARIARDRHDAQLASQEYRNAFAMKYYSTDAAPKALAEFAEYLVERSMRDSAVTILHELSDRYTLLTKAGAKAEIRAAELLEQMNRRDQAQGSLLRVAEARKDMLGGYARVRLGETYMRESEWRLALEQFELAKSGYTLSNESEVRRSFDLAQTAIALKKKSVAISALRALLRDSTLNTREEERATTMLHALVPPKKTKQHKKGGRGR